MGVCIIPAQARLLPATHDASSFCALCCHYAAHVGAGAALRAYLSYTMPVVFVHSENSIVMLPIFISHARNSSATNIHERRLSTFRAIRQFQNCLVVLHFLLFCYTIPATVCYFAHSRNDTGNMTNLKVIFRLASVSILPQI